MKFEAIIFDFDGVIADSEVTCNAALADLLTGLGRPTTLDQALDLYAGRRWSDCHRLIERDLGRHLDSAWLEREVDAAVAARAHEVLAIEGIERFLERQAGRRLAIASSSEKHWLDSFLARLGLAHWFGDDVYSAARLERGKPHPDVYLMVAERLGVEPSACLVVEDHPVGAAAGVAAGMTVIGLLAASHIRVGHAERLKEVGVQHIARDYGEAADIVARLEEAG